MRGDQLARQWRIIRAIAASPNGLTVTEIAQREEPGIPMIYRELEALQAAGFPLYSERGNRSNHWAFIDTFKFKTPPPFTLPELISYFHRDLVCRPLDQALPRYPVGRWAVDFIRNPELFDLIPMKKSDFAAPAPEPCLSTLVEPVGRSGAGAA